MIVLDDENTFTNKRKSSKGNQLKWVLDKTWYKADYLGYEGLAEYVVSRLLQYSSLDPSEYVDYETEDIAYKLNTFHGCQSMSFLRPGERLITLNRLFLEVYGYDLYGAIWHIPDEKDRLIQITNSVIACTGLNHFGEYLCKLLEIDALFLNEDRHFHNIALIQKDDGSFSYAPVFDNGAALMSDTTIDYPMHGDIYKMINTVKGKTISSSLERQIEIAEEVFDIQIHFTFKEKDIVSILQNEKNYDEQTKIRVLDILLEQKRKYNYLFVKQ